MIYDLDNSKYHIIKFLQALLFNEILTLIYKKKVFCGKIVRILLDKKKCDISNCLLKIKLYNPK